MEGKFTKAVEKFCDTTKLTTFLGDLKRVGINTADYAESCKEIPEFEKTNGVTFVGLLLPKPEYESLFSKRNWIPEVWSNGSGTLIVTVLGPGIAGLRDQLSDIYIPGDDEEPDRSWQSDWGYDY